MAESFVWTRRRVWPRRAAMTAVVAVLVFVAVWSYNLAQAYIITGDDARLGASYAHPIKVRMAIPDKHWVSALQARDEQPTLPPVPTTGARGITTAMRQAADSRCSALALGIYDHPMHALEVHPFPGWATPAEKAFYYACMDIRADPSD